MKLALSFTPFLAILLFCAAAHADVVYLNDGSTIEGKVGEEDGKIKIEQKHGYILIARHLVKRIEKAPTREELLKERLEKIDEKNADALREVAKWCRDVSLTDEAREFEAQAMKITLNAKWESISHTDANVVFEFALWCKTERYDSDTVEHFLHIVISINNDHAGAREMLGHRRFRSEWLPAAETERIKEQEYEQKMRESGMVKYKGEWLKPDAAAFLAERERLDREKMEVEEERARLRDIELRIAQESAEVRRERSYLESERRGIERDNAVLNALALSLAQERRYLCDLKREVEGLKRDVECRKNDMERQKRDIDEEWRKIADERERLRREWDRTRVSREVIDTPDCCPDAERPKKQKTNKIAEREQYPTGRQSSSRDEASDSRKRVQR